MKKGLCILDVIAQNASLRNPLKARGSEYPHVDSKTPIRVVLLPKIALDCQNHPHTDLYHSLSQHVWKIWKHEKDGTFRNSGKVAAEAFGCGTRYSSGSKKAIHWWKSPNLVRQMSYTYSCGNLVFVARSELRHRNTLAIISSVACTAFSNWLSTVAILLNA